jgi:hypothetical protein
MLTEIYLGGQSSIHQQLKGSIPQGLSSLKQLVDLQLDYCQLTGSIPGGLDALTSLSLQGNHLTGTVPALPFNKIKNYCSLQNLKNPTNRFDCPLPPVSM